MDDEKRKTGGAKGDPTSAADKETAKVRQARADAAAQILETVHRLRQTAEKHELKMIVYLLDMVALEARDRISRPGRDNG